MREIKFRVWDEEKKKMYPIQRHSFKTNKSMPYGWNMEYIFEDLMQYLGFKDDNEKEVYEGDILKVSYCQNYYEGSLLPRESTGVVEYRNLGVYELKTGMYNGVGCYSSILSELSVGIDIDDITIEVMGNIYENKDLLEEVMDRNE